jgi:dipeptidyl aminopeptidase/acylaminoacyl peptidase
VLGGSRFLAQVAVSPDGRWLAYYSRGGQFDILINRTDGTGERQLTNDPAYDRNPTFSPDGQWIAFMSNRSGKSQLWLIRPDGSGLRQATNAPNGAQSYNEWSPDGSQLHFLEPSGPDMFFFDPRKPWNEQTPTVLPGVTETGLEFSPSFWTPDGKQLLGVAGPENKDGIFTYAFASKRFTRLSDVGEPWSWLNDGHRLLYTHHGKLFVLDSVSKSARELLSVAPDDFDSVALSPDNRTIYFTRATKQGDIWLMTLK